MSKQKTTRKCVVCGKAFEPKSSNASVCGEVCRKELKRQRKCKAAKGVKCEERINLDKESLDISLDCDLPEKVKKHIIGLAQIDPIELLKIAKYAKIISAAVLASRVEKMFKFK